METLQGKAFASNRSRICYYYFYFMKKWMRVDGKIFLRKSFLSFQTFRKWNYCDWFQIEVERQRSHFADVKTKNGNVRMTARMCFYFECGRNSFRPHENGKRENEQIRKSFRPNTNEQRKENISWCIALITIRIVNYCISKRLATLKHST